MTQEEEKKASLVSGLTTFATQAYFLLVFLIVIFLPTFWGEILFQGKVVPLALFTPSCKQKPLSLTAEPRERERERGGEDDWFTEWGYNELIGQLQPQLLFSRFFVFFLSHPCVLLSSKIDGMESRKNYIRLLFHKNYPTMALYIIIIIISITIILSSSMKWNSSDNLIAC